MSNHDKDVSDDQEEESNSNAVSLPVEQDVNLHMLATTVVSLEPEMACRDCPLLQQSLNENYIALQSTKQQHSKALATLKKKIISTDLLIREYQSQKNECEVLKRKIEEFACLVSQLDKDLARYKADLMKALNELEPLKKLDADRTKALEDARKESELAVDQTAALLVTNNQLEAKVRQLESAETAAAQDETKLKALAKDLKKAQRALEQQKEEKNDYRKKFANQRHEIVGLRNKLRKTRKYAMTWGRLAEKHGILVGPNRRVFDAWLQQKGEEIDDVSPVEESDYADAAFEEAEEGHLLEMLLSNEHEGGNNNGDASVPVPTKSNGIRAEEEMDVDKTVLQMDAITHSKLMPSLALPSLENGNGLSKEEERREGETVHNENQITQASVSLIPNLEPSTGTQTPSVSDLGVVSHTLDTLAVQDSDELGLTFSFEAGETATPESKISEEVPSHMDETTSEMPEVPAAPPVPFLAPEKAPIEDLDLSSEESHSQMDEATSKTPEVPAASPIPSLVTEKVLIDDLDLSSEEEKVVALDKSEVTASETSELLTPENNHAVMDSLDASQPKPSEADTLKSSLETSSYLTTGKDDALPGFPALPALLNGPMSEALNPTSSGDKPVVERHAEDFDNFSVPFPVPTVQEIATNSLKKKRKTVRNSGKSMIPSARLTDKDVTSDLQAQKEELEQILRDMTRIPFMTPDDIISPLPTSPVPEKPSRVLPPGPRLSPPGPPVTSVTSSLSPPVSPPHVLAVIHSSSMGFEATLTDTDLTPPPQKLATATLDSILGKVSVQSMAMKETSVAKPVKALKTIKPLSVRPACLFDWRGKKLEAKPPKGRPIFMGIVNPRTHKIRIPYLRLGALKPVAFPETYLPVRSSSVTNFAEAECKYARNARNLAQGSSIQPESPASSESITPSPEVVKTSKKYAKRGHTHADLFGESGSEDNEDVTPPLPEIPPLRTLPRKGRTTIPRIHPVHPASVTLALARKAIATAALTVKCNEKLLQSTPSSLNVAREPFGGIPGRVARVPPEPPLTPSLPSLPVSRPHQKSVSSIVIDSPPSPVEEIQPRRQRKARLVSIPRSPKHVQKLDDGHKPSSDEVARKVDVEKIRMKEETEMESEPDRVAPVPEEMSASEPTVKHTSQRVTRKRKRNDGTEMDEIKGEEAVESPSFVPPKVESPRATRLRTRQEAKAQPRKLTRFGKKEVGNSINELPLEEAINISDSCESHASEPEEIVEDDAAVSGEEQVSPTQVPIGAVLSPEIDKSSTEMIPKEDEEMVEFGEQEKPALSLVQRQRLRLEKLVAAPFTLRNAEASPDIAVLEKPSSDELARKVEEKNRTNQDFLGEEHLFATECLLNPSSAPASPTPLSEGEESNLTVREIPLESTETFENRLLLPSKTISLEPVDTRPLLEIVQERMAQKIAAKRSLHLKPSTVKTMKKSVRGCLNKVTKAEELSSDLVMETAERLTRRDVQADPYFAAKHMVALLRRDETEIVTAFTPPAPPLTTTQQRLITIIQAVKKHPGMQEAAVPYDPEMVIVTTIRASLFKPSISTSESIPIYEMSALTRFAAAIMRCQGDIGQMRAFWYDIMYFLPTQAYALTYVLLIVWPDVLRHSTFCIGPSPLEQTMVYLLTTCNTVKAIPGPDGKVIAVRNLLRDAFGFQAAPMASVNDLCLYLIEKVKGCRGLDEMRSLASCFSLLPRWEGTKCGIRVVKEMLWPLLEEWSAGQGEDLSAATALVTMGWLGRTFPADEQDVNEKIVGVLKTLVSHTENISTVMQESILETLILLGAQVDKVMVCGLLKSWKPPRKIPFPLLETMCAFVGSNKGLINASCKDEIEG